MGIVKQLWQLQEIDTAVLEGKARLSEILQAKQTPQPLQSLRDQTKQAQIAIDHYESSYLNADEQLQEHNKQLETAVNKLYSGAIKNPKELADQEAYVATLEKKKTTLDTQMMDALSKAEALQEHHSILNKKLTQLEAAWEKETADLNHEQQFIATKINELQEKRAKHVQKIDAKPLAQYEKLLKTKRGIAISALTQGICQTCRVTATSNILRETQARKIVHCTSCGRLLYAPH